MNSVLVDTSAYSALLRDHAGVSDFLSQSERLVLTPIVIGELLGGFRRGTRLEKNENLLRQFIDRESIDVLPVDSETAERYAIIYAHLARAGTPVSPNDLWIAASAMQHGLSLVTTDRDFLKIPQIIVHFFDANS